MAVISGVGVGAAQDGGVEHAGELNVGDVLGRSGQEPCIFFSLDGGAYVIPGHFWIPPYPRFSRLASRMAWTMAT